MAAVIKGFATTVSYVTCIPAVGRQIRHPDSGLAQIDLSGLAKYLSAAGLLIGAILCLFLWLLGLFHTDSILCATLLTVGWLCLTGGLHFDGLMDTADGIFSHQSVERMLEIMTDSRVGNYGVMTGVAVLLLKVACLASLPSAALYPVLLLSPSWARWCESFAIGKFPYLRDQGMGKVWHDTMRFPQDLFTGALLPITASVLLGFINPLVVIVVAAATVFAGLVASYALAKKFGGHTGDTYGAVVELAEVGGLLIVSLFLK
jgi:adenosylcobinamide-GDP ribazoletransferase